MKDLYVIVSAGTGEPLWASVTDADEAEAVAVSAAVNFGNVNLLNGADLAKHLTKRSATRYLATFQPQAWIRDEAVDVDPEGETTWDCTAFALEHIDYLESQFDRETGADKVRPAEALDNDDVFQRDPAAPDWVQAWRGPFSIYIEEASA